MNASQVRRELERRIHRCVPNDIWDWLTRQGFTHLEYGEEEEGMGTLVEQARFLLRLESRGNKPHPPPRQERVVPLSEYEFERALAVSTYLACLARPRAAAFRDRILDGRKLTVEEMLSFITSPATAAQRPIWFQKHGVALVGHQAVWVTENQVLVVKHPKLQARARGRPQNFLRFVRPDGWEYAQPVWRNSVLDQLRAVVGHLCRRYGWQTTQAIGFVLMDREPLIPSMSVRTTTTMAWDEEEIWHSGRITIIVDPWVSVSTVLRGLREAKKRLCKSENRPLAMRNMALFRFITKLTHTADKVPPWRKLMNAWNQSAETQAKRWEYADHRLCRRDYLRARDALLSPQLQEPGATKQH